MQRPFLYVKNISWYTVVLVWQCVGMQKDNFFCFSYNNYIQKIQEDRKMRLVDAVFMRIKELMKERGLTMYRLAIYRFVRQKLQL